MSELVFFSLMIVPLFLVLLCHRLGKEWLFAILVFLTITTAVVAGKIITIFGFDASIGTPLYAAIFLATDILAEHYGERDARKAVWMGFFASVLFVVVGQLIIRAPASANIELANALSQLFEFLPRLVSGGLFAYMISQQFDIWMFNKIRKWKPGRKWLWLRNNGSTLVSQAIDTWLVYMIAFYGLVPDIWQLMLVNYIVKVFVAFFDTFFIYLSYTVRSNVHPAEG